MDVPRSDTSDFYFVEAHDPEDGVAKNIEIVKHRLPKRFGFDPIKDIQVLCPMTWWSQRAASGRRQEGACAIRC